MRPSSIPPTSEFPEASETDDQSAGDQATLGAEIGAEIGAETETDNSPETETTEPDDAGGRWSTRRKAVIAAVVVVLLGAGVGLAYGLLRPAPSSAASGTLAVAPPPAPGASMASAPPAPASPPPSAPPASCPAIPVWTSASTSTAAGKPVALTADQVPYATITQNDLPAGWQVVEPSTTAASAASTSGYPPLDSLTKIMTGAPVRGDVRFTQPTSGELVEQAVAVPAAGTAASALVQFGAATRACQQFTVANSAGAPEQVAVRPLDAPRLADGSAAAQLTTTTTRGPVVVDVVAMRVGSVLTTLYLANVGSVPQGMVDTLAQDSIATVRTAARA